MKKVVYSEREREKIKVAKNEWLIKKKVNTYEINKLYNLDVIYFFLYKQRQRRITHKREPARLEQAHIHTGRAHLR